MNDDFNHRHWSGRLIYTDGVRWMAEVARAYWLVDLVASYQRMPRVRAEEFQVWKLTVHPNRSATATMTDGNSDKPIVQQDIPWTDYAEDECEMYLVRSPGQPAVLMLASEY